MSSLASREFLRSLALTAVMQRIYYSWLYTKLSDGMHFLLERRRETFITELDLFDIYFNLRIEFGGTWSCFPFICLLIYWTSTSDWQAHHTPLPSLKPSAVLHNWWTKSALLVSTSSIDDFPNINYDKMMIHISTPSYTVPVSSRAVDVCSQVGKKQGNGN
jgi:hypothetical protein